MQLSNILNKNKFSIKLSKANDRGTPNYTLSKAKLSGGKVVLCKKLLETRRIKGFPIQVGNIDNADVRGGG